MRSETSIVGAHSWKDHFIGGAITVGFLAVPAIGCAMAIIYNNPWWLWLLLPLFTFMEAGLFLAAVAWLAVAFYMNW